MSTPIPPDKKAADASANNASIFKQGAQSTEGARDTFDVLKYPLDIGTSNQPHYIMFYINVRQTDISQNEAIAKGVNNKPLYVDNSQANRSTTNGSDVAVSVAVAGGAMGAGSAAGQALGKVAGATLIQSMGGLVGTFAGLTLAPAAVLTSQDIAKGRNQVLLKSAIALYVTGVPTVEYKTNWQDSDLGLAALLGGYAGELSGFKDFWRRGGAIFNTAALKGAEDLKSNVFGDIAGTAQATNAIVPNPFKEQLFKSVGFRQFSFDYVFLPRNKSEYDEVQKILKTFKKYMHPTLGAGKIILKYPAEFSIVYCYKLDTNDELFKIANCALTDMKIKYGGEDFITFRGTPGAPSEIAMQLTFTELETLTQNRIEDGY